MWSTVYWTVLFILFPNRQKLGWGLQDLGCFSSSLGWCSSLTRPCSPSATWVCHSSRWNHLQSCHLIHTCDSLCRSCLSRACHLSLAWSAPSDSSSRGTNSKPPASFWGACWWCWSAGQSLALFWRSTASFSYLGNPLCGHIWTLSKENSQPLPSRIVMTPHQLSVWQGFLPSGGWLHSTGPCAGLATQLTRNQFSK